MTIRETAFADVQQFRIGGFLKSTRYLEFLRLYLLRYIQDIDTELAYRARFRKKG